MLFKFHEKKPENISTEGFVLNFVSSFPFIHSFLRLVPLYNFQQEVEIQKR